MTLWHTEGGVQGSKHRSDDRPTSWATVLYIVIYTGFPFLLFIDDVLPSSGWVFEQVVRAACSRTSMTCRVAAAEVAVAVNLPLDYKRFPAEFFILIILLLASNQLLKLVSTTPNSHQTLSTLVTFLDLVKYTTIFAWIYSQVTKKWKYIESDWLMVFCCYMSGSWGLLFSEVRERKKACFNHSLHFRSKLVPFNEYLWNSVKKAGVWQNKDASVKTDRHTHKHVPPRQLFLCHNT